MVFPSSYSARLATAALLCTAIITPAIAQQAQASGEVRRINIEQGKIIIKHDAIADLDLPAMSLAYYAQPELLKDIKPGDKVKFTAQRDNDRYVIVKISK